jgi:Protein of unknown function (DUF992)
MREMPLRKLLRHATSGCDRWGRVVARPDQGAWSPDRQLCRLSADVAAGRGAGANAFIGGNKVVLQPESVSGNIGINLAAGIGLCGWGGADHPRIRAVRDAIALFASLGLAEPPLVKINCAPTW